MKIDETKQLLLILKSQVLVVTGQKNEKMDVIVQCRGIFCKFGCSDKHYVEGFNFHVQITIDVKKIREFKETIRYLLLLLFLGPFYLTLLLPTVTPRSQGGIELRCRT